MLALAKEVRGRSREGSERICAREGSERAVLSREINRLVDAGKMNGLAVARTWTKVRAKRDLVKGNEFDLRHFAVFNS